MGKQLLKIFCIACLLFVPAGCTGNLKSSEHADVSFSTWLAYWDMDSGMSEYKKVRRQMTSISYFAAYFTEDGTLAVPKEIEEAKKKEKKPAGKGSFLTIVNDKIFDNGKMAEKDIDVLRQVFANEVVMDRHIADIVQLTKEGGYDGVEIDYERIWKDRDLKEKYLDFLYRLYRQAIKAGLKVRIVLEPSAPFDAAFCKGPEYVVMMYNLYGTHSGPGPKADAAFIRKTLKRMESLPGNKAVAFATGGCVWEESGVLGLEKGKNRFINENEAVRLAQKYKVKLQRDGDSACLHFAYVDGNKNYTVWYADSETLNAWISIAADNGITSISMWRLGGNADIEKVK